VPRKRIFRENGTGTLRSDGYVHVMVENVRYYQHVFVAEKALRKKLPVGAEVHHVDGDRSNNDPSNLVICPNKNYHELLHKRQKALEACGIPSWEKCRVCKTYDSIENLKGVSKDGRRHHKGVMREICNLNKGIVQ